MMHSSFHRSYTVLIVVTTMMIASMLSTMQQPFTATTSSSSFLLFVSAEDSSSSGSTPYVFTTYRATIIPLPNNVIGSEVSGFVVLHTKKGTDTEDSNGTSSSSILGYAGMIDGIEMNLTAASCTAVNGCGVHVHSGKSCENTTTQGGHYYNNLTLDVDPWIEERYYTSTNGSIGTSTFSGLLHIGSTDIEGRVFLVHSENGTRIGCGVIEEVDDGDSTLNTVTSELADSDVTGQVSVYLEEDSSVVCYFGLAMSLEPDLTSYLNPNPLLPGTDCNYTNGCGVHIHNGTSCANTTTQGGHYYDSNIPDPWKYTMYYTTDLNGDAYFTGCVLTGITDQSSFNERPFIIHANNGSRVSCGLLETPLSGSGGSSGLPPSPSMARPPSSSPTSYAASVSMGIPSAIAICVLLVMMLL